MGDYLKSKEIRNYLLLKQEMFKILQLSQYLLQFHELTFNRLC